MTDRIAALKTKDLINEHAHVPTSLEVELYYCKQFYEVGTAYSKFRTSGKGDDFVATYESAMAVPRPHPEGAQRIMARLPWCIVLDFKQLKGYRFIGVKGLDIDKFYHLLDKQTIDIDDQERHPELEQFLLHTVVSKILNAHPGDVPGLVKHMSKFLAPVLKEFDVWVKSQEVAIVVAPAAPDSDSDCDCALFELAPAKKAKPEAICPVQSEQLRSEMQQLGHLTQPHLYHEDGVRSTLASLDPIPTKTMLLRALACPGGSALIGHCKATLKHLQKVRNLHRDVVASKADARTIYASLASALLAGEGIAQDAADFDYQGFLVICAALKEAWGDGAILKKLDSMLTDMRTGGGAGTADNILCDRSQQLLDSCCAELQSFASDMTRFAILWTWAVMRSSEATAQSLQEVQATKQAVHTITSSVTGLQVMASVPREAKNDMREAAAWISCLLERRALALTFMLDPHFIANGPQMQRYATLSHDTGVLAQKCDWVWNREKAAAKRTSAVLAPAHMDFISNQANAEAEFRAQGMRDVQAEVVIDFYTQLEPGRCASLDGTLLVLPCSCGMDLEAQRVSIKALPCGKWPGRDDNTKAIVDSLSAVVALPPETLETHGVMTFADDSLALLPNRNVFVGFYRLIKLQANACCCLLAWLRFKPEAADYDALAATQDATALPPQLVNSLRACARSVDAIGSILCLVTAGIEDYSIIHSEHEKAGRADTDDLVRLTHRCVTNFKERTDMTRELVIAMSEVVKDRCQSLLGLGRQRLAASFPQDFIAKVKPGDRDEQWVKQNIFKNPTHAKVLTHTDALATVDAKIKACGVANVSGPEAFWVAESQRVKELIEHAQLYVAVAGILSTLLLKRKKMSDIDFKVALNTNIEALKDMGFWKLFDAELLDLKQELLGLAGATA